jgi:hypothetical protein
MVCILSLAAVGMFGLFVGVFVSENLRYRRWHLTLHAIQDSVDLGELQEFTAKKVFAVVTEYQKLSARLLVKQQLPCGKAN